MKKLFTLLLAVAGMVGTASAYDNIYFVSSLNGYSKSADMFTYQYHKDTENEDVYTFDVDATNVGSSDYIYFRMFISGWVDTEISPYKDNSYKFTIADGSIVSETTGSKYDKDYYQSKSVAYCIDHPSFGASKYRVTIFRGFNNVNYENENCRVMWVNVQILEMPVTISSYGMSTFCCKRALNFEGTGITANIITSSNKSTGELTKLAKTAIPANTGLFLEGSAGTVNVPVLESATAFEETNMLVGVTTNTGIGQTTDSYTNYILTVNKAGGNVGTPKFYKVNGTSGNTVLANKAYLQILTANAARESFWFGEEATAIDAMQQEPAMDGQAFNLAGQRIAQPAKGLYIVNGKKYIK